VWSEIAAPFSLALVVRVALALWAPVEPSWDGAVYVRAAEQLARGEGYTLRILDERLPPKPTAYYPIGYAALLSLVHRLGGDTRADLVLQALLGAALVPLAYLLARRAGGRRSGRFAAWAAALWPGSALLSMSFLAEPLFAFGLGMALLPLAYARRARRIHALAASALLLGAVAYVRATALPIALCLGLCLGLGSNHRTRDRRLARLVHAFAFSALSLMLALVPLSPWVLRNVHALGGPVLVSSNGGANLLIGTRGDGGYAPLPSDSACYARDLPELARDSCFARAARAQITSDPLGWLARGVLKLANTFGHESAPAQAFQDGLRLHGAMLGTIDAIGTLSLGICRLAFLSLAAAALAGALILVRRGPALARGLLFAPCVALAALHFVYLGGDRYHLAVMPCLLALEGVGLGELTRASGSRS
jgi:4-amino-4-deoxy-L-arabinose transferase-like glycosyltransferase